MRLAKSDLYAALDRAAAEIISAAGDDGNASRRDVRLRVRALEPSFGELVSALYRFIDHRDDERPGVRVTRRDVLAAVEAAKRGVDRADLNHSGLSSAEVERIEETGRFAAALVREAKRSVRPEARPPKELTQALGQLARGLVFDDFGTEGTNATFETFVSTRPVMQLTPGSFRLVVDRTDDRPENMLVRFEPADGFFDRLPDVQLPHNRDRAAALVREMRASLLDPTAIVVGLDDPEVPETHPFYVVGLDPNGHVVGLHSEVVWT